MLSDIVSVSFEPASILYIALLFFLVNGKNIKYTQVFSVILIR